MKTLWISWASETQMADGKSDEVRSLTLDHLSARHRSGDLVPLLHMAAGTSLGSGHIPLMDETRIVHDDVIDFHQLLRKHGLEQHELQLRELGVSVLEDVPLVADYDLEGIGLQEIGIASFNVLRKDAEGSSISLRGARQKIWTSPDVFAHLFAQQACHARPPGQWHAHTNSAFHVSAEHFLPWVVLVGSQAV